MTKVAKKKRGRPPGSKTKKPLASRPTKPSTNGATNGAGQSDKFAPNQPPLDTMQDVDERIKPLDDECQRFLAEVDKKKSAKEAADACRQKIGELLKKHELEWYNCNGKKFWIEPGTPTVKVTKLNQRDRQAAAQVATSRSSRQGV